MEERRELEEINSGCLRIQHSSCPSPSLEGTSNASREGGNSETTEASANSKAGANLRSLDGFTWTFWDEASSNGGLILSISSGFISTASSCEYVQESRWRRQACDYQSNGSSWTILLQLPPVIEIETRGNYESMTPQARVLWQRYELSILNNSSCYPSRAATDT